MKLCPICYGEAYVNRRTGSFCCLNCDIEAPPGIWNVLRSAADVAEAGKRAFYSARMDQIKGEEAVLGAKCDLGLLPPAGHEIPVPYIGALTFG